MKRRVSPQKRLKHIRAIELERRRVDVVLVISAVVFAIEFKVGEKNFLSTAIDQVWDYALDLKNFHETSHTPVLAPVLIATEASRDLSDLKFCLDADALISPPVRTNGVKLCSAIDSILEFVTAEAVDCDSWDSGRYAPTPTCGGRRAAKARAW